MSLVVTRLDYCNAVLGLPAYQLDRLQSVINAAARMIYMYLASRYDHVSSLLKELHWLRVPERREFKLCALVYKCLNGNGPAYLADSLQRVTDRSPVTSTPAVVFVVNADRPGDTSCNACNAGGPCVSGRRCPGLERPTRLRHVSVNLRIIPYCAEDVSVFQDFLTLTTRVVVKAFFSRQRQIPRQNF